MKEKEKHIPGKKIAPHTSGFRRGDLVGQFKNRLLLALNYLRFSSSFSENFPPSLVQPFPFEKVSVEKEARK